MSPFGVDFDFTRKLEKEADFCSIIFSLYEKYSDQNLVTRKIFKSLLAYELLLISAWIIPIGANYTLQPLGITELKSIYIVMTLVGLLCPFTSTALMPWVLYTFR